MTETLQVLSYGAGVQTFGILCLIKLGELPKPDLLIFADTQDESPETYYHINDSARPLAYQLGIEWVDVTDGSIYRKHLENGHTMTSPICSKTAKTRKIEQRLRRYNYYAGLKIITWIGISTDEEERSFSQSEVSYVEKRYPLIELDLSRDEVKEKILLANEIIPPKSGCQGCTWRGTQYWLNMKAKDPKKFNLYKELENGGHKLPRYGPSLTQISLQMVLPGWEGDLDNNCSTGACMV